MRSVEKNRTQKKPAHRVRWAGGGLELSVPYGPPAGVRRRIIGPAVIDSRAKDRASKDRASKDRASKDRAQPWNRLLVFAVKVVMT